MNSISRRTAFLDEIGIGPVWLRRHSGDEPLQPVSELAQELIVVAEPAVELPVAPAPVVVEPMPPAAPVQAPPSTAEATAPTVSAWSDEPEPPVVWPAVPKAPDNPASASLQVAELDWSQLQDAVAGCTRCGLCHGRRNTVFGVGDKQAKWLFIGEGPGRNEDMQGEPFVGPAGKLLDNMLVAMGLKRGDNAYIANIVKCRPTDDNGRDRPPSAEEVAACLPYLQRQIALIQPTVLVALGKTAALSLLELDPKTPVSTLRGKVHRYAGRPLVVTYHPAYLLRQLADKGKVWSDLCLAMSTYANPGE
ncbi:uracil-DNA glycosylase [Paraherbaspirillum soli]|uniref:Type-4 uracil-DNA glycosylase n=1 Tax=Paraherbaspirillum soli TaxID=631222 RepID=A0ABW0M6K9_9BURK